MRCRRICRELLWLARFGEFGPSSAPHLDHLASCRSCRDEVGFDRALVRQLRTALAARIEAASPSPGAWEGVLERMRQPQPRSTRVREWSLAIVARLRVGTAMAGASLALMLALNLDIVAVVPVDPSPAIVNEATAVSSSRSIPSADGLRNSGQVPPGASAPAPARPGAEPIVATAPRPEPDAEHVLTSGPLSSGSTRAGTDAIAATEPAVVAAPSGDSVVEWRALTIRVSSAASPATDASSADTDDEPEEGEAPSSAPAPSQPGGPS